MKNSDVNLEFTGNHQSGGKNKKEKNEKIKRIKETIFQVEREAGEEKRCV